MPSTSFVADFPGMVNYIGFMLIFVKTVDFSVFFAIMYINDSSRTIGTCMVCVPLKITG